MTLTEDEKRLYIETAQKLKGSDRCRFMAQVVRIFGHVGQRLAEQELGWCRDTIRKGTHELESEIHCLDNFAAKEPLQDTSFPRPMPDYSFRIGRVPLLVLSIHDNIARSPDKPERSREYRTRECLQAGKKLTIH